MFDVLDAVVVAVEHLAVDDQPEGVGACHLDNGALAVLLTSSLFVPSCSAS